MVFKQAEQARREMLEQIGQLEHITRIFSSSSGFLPFNTRTIDVLLKFEELTKRFSKGTEVLSEALKTVHRASDILSRFVNVAQILRSNSNETVLGDLSPEKRDFGQRKRVDGTFFENEQPEIFSKPIETSFRPLIRG